MFETAQFWQTCDSFDWIGDLKLANQINANRQLILSLRSLSKKTREKFVVWMKFETNIFLKKKSKNIKNIKKKRKEKQQSEKAQSQPGTASCPGRRWGASAECRCRLPTTNRQHCETPSWPTQSRRPWRAGEWIAAAHASVRASQCAPGRDPVDTSERCVWATLCPDHRNNAIKRNAPHTRRRACRRRGQIAGAHEHSLARRRRAA